MIRDAKLIFSDAQAVTVDADSSNILDLGKDGNIDDLYLEVGVDASAAAVGAATVTFALVTATDAAFTTPITLYSSAAIGKASLAAKAVPVKTRVPMGVLQFLKVTYTIGTGPLTAGKFNAYLAQSVESVTPVLR